MNDMNLLHIVERQGKNNKFEWRVTKHIRELVEKAGFYTIESEIKRARGDGDILEIREEKRKIKIKLKRG